MGENSAIEWTDHTFNPVWGCVKVSPACDNCYAAALDHRLGGGHWGPHAPLKEFGDKHWAEPLKWNRAAERDGVRRRVFCASMADVFDNRWPEHVRSRLWELIKATPHLDWLLLTKRPQNIARMLPDNWGNGYSNVWLGTTVENQEEADRRIAHLLAVPAKIRFLSCEPLLGPLHLRWALSCNPLEIASGFQRRGHFSPGLEKLRRLDWVIAGGESGHGARPIHPDWSRALRDQCAAVGVPFLFKQWGEWGPRPSYEEVPIGTVDRHSFGVARIGKKRAGRLLDGVEHNAFPEMMP
ncbi:MAG: hypothetical protein JWO51_1086 [Rhodospirillales bacterium]|nr:hypothetical protein [Rhodospirillales bacterium]